MNLMRTAMLLAFMTALFMGVGYLIGGHAGMMIALVAAAGMNFFSYWNSGSMVTIQRRSSTPTGAGGRHRCGGPDAWSRRWVHGPGSTTRTKPATWPDHTSC